MITAVLSLFRRSRLKDYDGISTDGLERLLAHAEEHGLRASAEHYEWILAARRRRDGCPHAICHHNLPGGGAMSRPDPADCVTKIDPALKPERKPS